MLGWWREERALCLRETSLPHGGAGSDSVEEAEFGCHTQASEALGKSLTSRAPSAPRMPRSCKSQAPAALDLAGPREGEMTMAAGAVLCSLAVSLLLNDDLGWSAKDRKVENVSPVDTFEGTPAESCTPAQVARCTPKAATGVG